MQTITIVYTILFFFGIYFLMLFVLLSTRNKKLIHEYLPLKTFPHISVIVPAYNEESTIIGTLKAVISVDYPENKKEIIVINDGSTDNTEEVIKEFMKSHSQIKLLNKSNSGKADSLNQAVKIAKGELIAIVDADSFPRRDSFQKMIGFFEDDEKIAAVTSRILVKNRKNFVEYFQDFDYTVIAWDRKILDFINCVYVTPGPLSIYRKSVLTKVGGFDKKNLTEDIEITWNLLSKNYKTKMAYSAETRTLTPDNFRQWVKQRIRWNLGGWQTLFKYKKFFFKGETFFGYFIMNYMLMTFFLSLIGIMLLLRFIIIKSKLYFFSIPFILKGYNPFLFIRFNFSLTILLILGLVFFIMSTIYYKYVIKDTEMESKGILNILIYTLIYRTLYIIPFIMALFKLLRGDIRWYTK